MTPRQRKFADEYIICGNATQAYKAAYPNITKQRTAESAGARLLSNVKVAEYIRNRNNEISNCRIADMREVKEFWSGIMRDSRQEMKERLKASELIAKTNGAFIEKVKLEESVLKVEILGDYDDC